LLLMDEPTTHLDIPSRDVLEEALDEYPGTLVMISHDRHVIERLARRVIEVGGGTQRSYLGSYRDYLERKEGEAAANQAAAAAVPAAAGAARAGGPRSREERRREAEARNARSRKLGPVKREMDQLEREIEALGRQAGELEAAMADPDFYQSGARFEETFRSYRSLKAVIDSKTQRWDGLAATLDRLEREEA
jgi:ATP-binding cassette subfamily F protein 3